MLQPNAVAVPDTFPAMGSLMATSRRAGSFASAWSAHLLPFDERPFPESGISNRRPNIVGKTQGKTQGLGMKIGAKVYERVLTEYPVSD